jgi:hypothetical protein
VGIHAHKSVIGAARCLSYYDGGHECPPYKLRSKTNTLQAISPEQYVQFTTASIPLLRITSATPAPAIEARNFFASA